MANDYTVSQDIDQFLRSANDPAARNELGLGSAATSDSTDFAASSHPHVSGDITNFQASVESNTEVAANTSARHTHTNKAVLDATEESYTTADQTTLNTALQSGDNVSDLVNDAGYLTTAVQSGDNVSDLVNDAGYLTTAVQSGDNVSDLVNDAGYLTTAIQSSDIDTLAELNAVLTDANLDDATSSRTPTAHNHALSDLTQSGATDGQVIAWNNSAGEYQPVNNTGASSSPQSWYVTKMGSEADDTSGTGEKTAWIAPANGKINAVHSGSSTVTSGSALTVDVQINATTILTTKGIISNGDDSTSTGTNHALISNPTSFSTGDRISFHVDTFGGTGAKGLHTDLLISWD